MWTLYKKEVAGFFSSLIGYLTIGVFLVVSGLMLWVLNGNFNILNYGYADMDGLFLATPFLYLFLIPAISMRTFAEERRNGTIEMLMTRPISDWTIVCSKFLAAWTLVLISLLPTLVTYFSVVTLGDPVGNIDTGSVIGSYIGLLLLGGAFCTIGIFCSSLTQNQIVAFILSALICAVMYLGFESIYNMGFLGNAGLFIKSLGIMDHYESISRGVVDTRDVIYFASVMALFLMATRMVMQSRRGWNGWNKRKELKRSNWIEMGATVFIVVFLNVIGTYFFTRFDLTSERRYTLSDHTKHMLKKIDEPVLFRVYLEGDFPSDFQRLHNEAKEMLNQFRAYNKNVQYEFFNPNSIGDHDEQQMFRQKMYKKGIQPIQIQVGGEGEVTSMFIWPTAELTYKGRETSVQLLMNQKYVSDAELLNNSIQNLEYTLSSAIRSLAQGQKRTIGFLQGQGELNLWALYDIQRTLQEYYALDTVRINGQVQSLTRHIKNSSDSNYSFVNIYDLIVVAKPTKPFSERDLYILDQYVMHGGKVLWLIDALDADMDSLQSKGQAIATRYPLGLDEMLFAYGVRISPDLVMDVRCRSIPLQTGMVGETPQYRFFPWYYFPEIVPLSEHPIVRNLDLIKTDFVSSIDTISTSSHVKKTVLLATSEYSRIKNAPAIYDLSEVQGEPDRRLFARSSVPIAVLLEGTFTSAWRNRISPAYTSHKESGHLEASEETKMIVISDGDIIKNRYNMNEGTWQPLGYDNYTKMQYANRDFLLNAVNYLVGDEGMMASRSKSVKLRKLDVMKVKEDKTTYQVINVVVPVLILAAAGGIIVLIRKKRYNSKKK